MISERDNIKTNSLSAWILAARPKTLTGAIVPVMIGTAWAWKMGGAENFRFFPALLCFLFAFLMQIDSNFINDYFDCVKEVTTKRCALVLNVPARKDGSHCQLCAKDWSLPLCSLVSLDFLSYFMADGKWYLLVQPAYFSPSYTPPFSYLGLGDVLVLVFFGIIPVTFTTYVILPSTLQGVYPEVIMTSIACGLVIDTLLIVNNYRDRDNDKKSGKMTLIVRIGARKAEKLYNFLGLLAIIFTIQGRISPDNNGWKAYVIPLIIYIPYIFLHTKTQRYMVQIKQGRELNKVLALTARNILIYGILTTIVVLIS